MSKLRRPFLFDRYFFVTVRLLPRRIILQEDDFRLLARSLAKMRRKHGFTLTAWVFLPDYWHAIIYPTYPLSISVVFKAIKVSSMIAINVARGTGGEPSGASGQAFGKAASLRQAQGRLRPGATYGERIQ
jgi:REP element-mobilizing transposase RayT